MIDRFAAARAKVKRAKQHIADLERIVASLPDLDVSTIERDARTGCKIIKHLVPDVEKIAVEMALVIGDAIHNLRVGLEYAYLAAIERHIPPLDDDVTFPIRNTRQELEAALGGRDIKTRAPRLFDAMVSQIKPYNVGGNEFYAMLHKLDISDKHWLLIPLSHSAVVYDIIVEDEQGHEVSGDSWGIQGPGPYEFVFSGHVNIENKGNLSVEIVFDKGTMLKGVPIPSMLNSFSNLILSTIKILESV